MFRELFPLFGNSLKDVLNGTTITVGLIALVYLVRALIRSRLAGYVETKTRIDDLLFQIATRTRMRYWFFPALYVGIEALTVNASFARAVLVLGQLSLFIQLGLWFSFTVEFWLGDMQRRKLETDAAAATSIAAMTFVAKAVVWAFLVLVLLDNLGFDITTLLAGLGVGGVALALATQKILGDLFASLSIVLDKPFVIGDLITVGTEIGTVEYVGLKSTRIRSVTGEQLIISNSDLLAARIRNFKRMTERRVMLSFGVVYQTPAQKLERIPEMVKDIIDANEMTRHDRAHFKAFGPASLDFEAVYWILSPEMLDFMNEQEKVNLALVRKFEAEGIEFAYPTQTIYMKREDGQG